MHIELSQWNALGIVLAVAALAMSATWWVQVRTGNAGWVDVAWALLLGAAALFYGAVVGGATVPRLLTALLGGAWGLRLGLHLFVRVRHEREDGRYRYLREHWQGDQRKFYGFFLFQALLVGLFSVPFLAVAMNPVAGVTAWSVAGVALWALALGGETLADRQLARWRGDPVNRGRTCRAGVVGLFAPSQLFLRVAAMVRLGSAGGGFALVGLDAVWPRADGRLIAVGHRHSLHRGAGAALARRGLSALPARGEHVLSLVSEARGQVMDAIELAERALLPDALIRLGIRRLCAQRLRGGGCARRRAGLAALS